MGNVNNPLKNSILSSLLPEDQVEVIYGVILGGKFEINNEYLIIFDDIKNKDFLLWKYNILKDISTKPKIINNYIYFQTDNQFFKVKQKNIKVINTIKHEFFAKNKKNTRLTTRRLLNRLSSISLYIWWTDSGKIITQKNSRIGKLSLNNYTLEECKVIQKYFKTVWKIDVSFKSSNDKYWLRFNSTNLDKFLNVISL